jgi:hypothetical protein
MAKPIAAIISPCLIGYPARFRLDKLRPVGSQPLKNFGFFAPKLPPPHRLQLFSVTPIKQQINSSQRRQENTQSYDCYLGANVVIVGWLNQECVDAQEKYSYY